MSAFERIVLGMFQSAVYDALCRGDFGHGGTMRRNAGEVFYEVSDRLWRMP